MDDDLDPLAAARGLVRWMPIMLALWVAAAWFFFAPAKSSETTYGRTAMLVCPAHMEPFRRNLRWPPVCAQKI